MEIGRFLGIRNADLGRFPIDRLMSIINRLGSRIEVRVGVHRAETAGREALHSELARCEDPVQRRMNSM
jgi:hypothetical protein